MDSSPLRSPLKPNIPLQLTALFLVAFNLRVAMACIGPVLDDLRADLGLTRAQIGLLSTLPVLCMSVFAPFAQKVSAARGHETAILFATLTIAAASLVRAWANATTLLASAFFAGVGIAIAGTLLNTFVKQHFADRALAVNGLYSAALSLGAALSAGLVAPMMHVLESWRLAFAAWSIPGFVAAALWWVMLRKSPREASLAAKVRTSLPWNEGKAWIVTIFFGLQSVTFYVVLNWLAPMYVELGWSKSDSGWLLAGWIGAQVAFIFIVSRVANRSHDRRPWLIACSLAAVIAMAGFAHMPQTAPWMWVILLGFASGGWFPLCMTLPLDYSRNPSETGSWTAMMLFGGYLISGASPSIAGWARDSGASYAAIFAAMSVLSAVILVMAFWLKPTPREGGRA